MIDFVVRECRGVVGGAMAMLRYGEAAMRTLVVVLVMAVTAAPDDGVLISHTFHCCTATPTLIRSRSPSFHCTQAPAAA